MNFDSPIFLFCFFPAVTLLYYLLRGQRARNWLLLVAGLLFCAFGQLTGLILLLGVALINYLFGLAIMRLPAPKLWRALAVIFDLAFLCAFKYLDFFMSGLCAIFGSVWESAGLLAPVGVSFFIFKCLSYIIDTSRRPETGTRSFFRLLLYVSFFPQLVSGPITRFNSFDSQLNERPVSAKNAAEGLRRIICGLGKKLILAAAIGGVADAAYSLAPERLSAGLAWLGALAYCLQLYFDFSGYSDMAIGLGRVFGFETAENFNYPYASASIGEFWRRWHISLGSWFRDYVYIPLGGSRRGRAREAFNKGVVFALCGLWHGASMTFVVWGLWHGLLAAAESLRVIDVKRLNESRAGHVLCRVYTLFAVLLGFVIFRAPDIGAGLGYISAMFTGFAPSAEASAALITALDGEAVAMLLAGLLLSQPWLGDKLRAVCERNAYMEGLSYVLSALLFCLCVLRLASGGFAPFIYAQF